ncbi:MAG: lysophospholipid acyltransferase family protein [Desulfomonilaceae bacterium]
MKFSLFIDYVVFLLVRLIEIILWILPEKFAMAMGKVAGRLMFILFRDRKAAAIENLTIAFGKERPSSWIRMTALKSFEHLGQLAVEFFRIRKWTQEDMNSRIIIDGKLPYDLIMMPGRHGICLMTSHFGCFEVSAATTMFLGIRTNLIVTGLKNPFLSRYFFSRGGGDYEKTGIRTFPHKGVAKKLIQALREGEMVAFLGDQRGDAERGIFVNFFGSPAPANEIFARLAIDGEARVIPLCTYRLEDGRYQSIFGEEIRLQLTGDQRQDLIRVSQQFHDVFEAWLRIKPEQGFWLQRKWRRKPSKHRRGRRTETRLPAVASSSERARPDEDGAVPTRDAGDASPPN